MRSLVLDLFGAAGALAIAHHAVTLVHDTVVGVVAAL